MTARRAGSGWNKQKIVERIKALHRRNEDLSYNRMATKRQDLLAAANYHFGSWGRAVDAAGLNYARDVCRIPKWSIESIRIAIHEAHKSGEDLSWTSVTKGKKYSALAYAAIRENRFGSWDEALKAAGLDPAEVRRYEAWDEAKIIGRIKRRSKGGLPLNSKAMQDGESKLFNAALNYFGGWDKALEAAGIAAKTVYKRRRWNAELIKEQIKALHKAGEDLAAPNMRRHHSPLYSAACKYFGAWTAAREACGIRKDYLKRG